jgi:hypothetical protein
MAREARTLAASAGRSAALLSARTTEARTGNPHVRPLRRRRRFAARGAQDADGIEARQARDARYRSRRRAPNIGPANDAPARLGLGLCARDDVVPGLSGAGAGRPLHPTKDLLAVWPKLSRSQIAAHRLQCNRPPRGVSRGGGMRIYLIYLATAVAIVLAIVTLAFVMVGPGRL